MLSVYVENLPTDVTPADLWDLFLLYGVVRWAGVRPSDRDGVASQLGFVDFAAGGVRAVTALDGSFYRGRTIRVGYRSVTGS